MDWRQFYFLFAGLNLAVCLPLHLWLSRFARIAAVEPVETEEVSSPMVIGNANFVFVLIVLGFSLAGFVSAATLFHLVPMLGLLGLGTAGVWVASLLGPAQVASRLINMTFGKDLPRSEEHTSELQSLMRISYAVFCLKKKNRKSEAIMWVCVIAKS